MEVSQDKNLRPFDGKVYPFEINTTVSIEDETFTIDYKVTKLIDSIRLSGRKSVPQRTIGLWNDTCFELFLKNKGRNEYIEFNFSTSHDWNCFKFQNQNDELKEWTQLKKVDLMSFRDSNLFHLRATFLKSQLPSSFQGPKSFLYSTTAVIKHEDGSLSYWAIKHTDNRPNFHHPESFVELGMTP